MVAKLTALVMVMLLAGCGGGDDAFGTPPATPPGTSLAVAGIQLSISPITVKSDDSTTTTITVVALNAANAAVPSVVVTMGTDTGVLGASTVTTDTTGKGTLTFSSGASSKNNRTATITATAGSATAQIPVQIVGSTVTVSASSNTLSDDGTSPATLTITAKDAAGNPVSGTAVTLTNSGAGGVTFTPPSGTTNSSGQFTATVAGTGAGAVTVSATAVGATATTSLTVSSSGSTFSIDQQTLNAVVIANNDITAMKMGDSLVVRVNAPAPASNVVFATAIGVWNGGTSPVVTVPVVAGKATATLTTIQAGIASVQVYNQASPAISDSLTVAMTATTANSIIVQASPGVIQKSVGTTTGSSTLIATVRDAAGFPVGDAAVAFEIVNPTGGGETVSPVVVLSAATTAGGFTLGEARATFTSGSLTSDASGIKVRARVVGTTVVTGTTPSGSNAVIIIGGTAGSIAFGQATELLEGGNGANYILPMSVLVADANGNPAPLGTVVNLSVWPIAWSTNSLPCVVDENDGVSKGTFWNEDANENVILDPGEDGTRKYYATTATFASGTGAKNVLITPTNSAGGTLPATVMTDASGVATFDLTYGKSSALWIVDRIRARTIVQGSEAVGEIIFRLSALEKDTTPVCRLPGSPYFF